MLSNPTHVVSHIDDTHTVTHTHTHTHTYTQPHTRARARAHVCAHMCTHLPVSTAVYGRWTAVSARGSRRTHTVEPAGCRRLLRTLCVRKTWAVAAQRANVTTLHSTVSTRLPHTPNRMLVFVCVGGGHTLQCLPFGMQHPLGSGQGLQTIHTKLPYITPSMTISSNK